MKLVFNEVVRVVRVRVNADIILQSIGFPDVGRPTFPPDGQDRAPYWMDIAAEIDAGGLPTGPDFQPLVDAVADRYPTNEILRRHRSRNGAATAIPPDPGRPHVALVIQGWDDPSALVAAARGHAQAMGRNPADLVLGFWTTEGILLRLSGWTIEQGRELSQRIAAGRRGAERIRASVAANDFEDYLIRRLWVEGPDQRQFEINDVQASTRVSELGQGFMVEEYSDPKRGDRAGAGPRQGVVVDRVHPDGRIERLDPEKTLHEHQVQEDQSFSVSHQATAGSVDPAIREAALVRVKDEVLDFAEGYPGFEFETNSPIAPTEYMLRFRAPSFGPPRTPGGDPVEVEDHAVYLFLPADFPMKAPQAYWQAPVIFHPNIRLQNGAVCLGELADRYLPGLSFGKLCQLLIDIARYQNYAVDGVYNLDAGKWAISDRGQAAIMRRGGLSVTQMYLHGVQEPRRLWITPATGREDLGREERHEQQRELSD
jgi:ubiquitin-protein ligase